MKVIYLDIDGVLNCYSDHERLHNSLRTTGLIPEDIHFFTRGDYVVSDKLKRLQSIVSEYNAQVVIVSSWATFNGDSENICRFLKVPYHSDALSTGGGLMRGRKVIEHSELYNINSDDYIIIDDSGDQMYEDHSRLIHVDGSTGLCDNDIEKIHHLWSCE